MRRLAGLPAKVLLLSLFNKLFSIVGPGIFERCRNRCRIHWELWEWGTPLQTLLVNVDLLLYTRGKIFGADAKAGIASMKHIKQLGSTPSLHLKIQNLPFFSFGTMFYSGLSFRLCRCPGVHSRDLSVLLQRQRLRPEIEGLVAGSFITGERHVAPRRSHRHMSVWVWAWRANVLWVINVTRHRRKEFHPPVSFFSVCTRVLPVGGLDLFVIDWTLSTLLN